MGFKWPWSHGRSEFVVTVDFNKKPALPQGTVKLLNHVPAASGVVTLSMSDLLLKPIPAGSSYAAYYREHGGNGCGDALIIDAIFEFLKANSDRKHPDKLIRRFFGNFWGQIFFLGSTFASVDGTECVTFLNIDTVDVTGMPAVRYSCPLENPVRPDVPVYACYLKSVCVN